MVLTPSIPSTIDVTDEYYDTKDIERDILHEYSDRKVAYICVYDTFRERL